MKLDFSGADHKQTSWSWSATPELSATASLGASYDLRAGQWVHLLDLPNAYSFDEALLLCPCDNDQWVAWIPDHGETVLHPRQFCVNV